MHCQLYEILEVGQGFCMFEHRTISDWAVNEEDIPWTLR
jgi:hypothetical protein